MATEQDQSENARREQSNVRVPVFRPFSAPSRFGRTRARFRASTADDYNFHFAGRTNKDVRSGGFPMISN